jgi:hypothetical protein
VNDLSTRVDNSQAGPFKSLGRHAAPQPHAHGRPQPRENPAFEARSTLRSACAVHSLRCADRKLITQRTVLTQ